MKIIEIKALENGGHDNQTIHSIISAPEGWAVVPDNMDTPNFPFGEIEVAELGGVMTVTKWTAGTVPEPEPESENKQTTQDDTDSMLVDHEYRITLLELGVNE